MQRWLTLSGTSLAAPFITQQRQGTHEDMSTSTSIYTALLWTLRDATWLCNHQFVDDHNSGNSKGLSPSRKEGWSSMVCSKTIITVTFSGAWFAVCINHVNHDLLSCKEFPNSTVVFINKPPCKESIDIIYTDFHNGKDSTCVWSFRNNWTRFHQSLPGKRLSIIDIMFICLTFF